MTRRFTASVETLPITDNGKVGGREGRMSESLGLASLPYHADR